MQTENDVVDAQSRSHSAPNCFARRSTLTCRSPRELAPAETRNQLIGTGGTTTASMPGLEQLTLLQCHDVIGRLAAQIDDLRAQLALLQERMKLDSRNSSKPPSSDGPGSGGNRAQRRASERGRGAQKGHKGTSRAVLDEGLVDHIVDCAPPEVCECGALVLAGSEPLRHQVFDVPPVRAVVNEY